MTGQYRATGEYLRTKRTDFGYTQADLGRMARMAATYVGQIEAGKIHVVKPAAFNRLRNVLHFAGWDWLEAMGYKTDGGIEGVSPALLGLIASMSPAQQSLLTKTARMYLLSWDGKGDEAQEA
jgi:transcriptional regulator with XRE-family HTH domain